MDDSWVMHPVNDSVLAWSGFKTQELANLAWSLAVMNQADEDLLNELLLSAQMQRNELTVIEAHQLYQVSSLSYVAEVADASYHG